MSSSNGRGDCPKCQRREWKFGTNSECELCGEVGEIECRKCGYTLNEHSGEYWTIYGELDRAGQILEEDK